MPDSPDPSASPNLNLARERQAFREVGVTQVAPGTAWLACGVFVLLLSSGVALELVAGDPGALVPASLRSAAIPEACTLRELDHALETGSALAERVGRPMQVALAALGRGNASVVNAGAGGLALRAELAHLTGPDFMDPDVQQRREQEAGGCDGAVHADPVAALVGFSQQLSERGIQLVVVPTPGKLATEPDRLIAGRSPAARPMANPGSARFRAALDEAGIEVFDPATVLRELESKPRFLERDSHWRPHAVEAVAAALARVVAHHLEGGEAAEAGAGPPARPFRRERSSARNVGDLAALLGMRSGAETVELAALVEPDDAGAPVLLLGDSYSAIYSERQAFRRVFDGSLDWGADAGLAEQLAFALERPVRSITRNAGGAAASRQALAVELARGDPLAGVQVVVLQFAARELSLGSWDPVALTASVGTAAAVPQGVLRVTGRIAARSALPTPGETPYAEAVFAVHLRDVRGQGDEAPEELVVYLLGMSGQRLTPAARLPVGGEVALLLEPWDAPGVQAELGALYRTELDDLRLIQLPAYYGEVQP